jgi:hypothetical protein
MFKPPMSAAGAVYERRRAAGALILAGAFVAKKEQ